MKRNSMGMSVLAVLVCAVSVHAEQVAVVSAGNGSARASVAATGSQASVGTAFGSGNSGAGGALVSIPGLASVSTDAGGAVVSVPGLVNVSTNAGGAMVSVPGMANVSAAPGSAVVSAPGVLVSANAPVNAQAQQVIAQSVSVGSSAQQENFLVAKAQGFLGQGNYEAAVSIANYILTSLDTSSPGANSILVAVKQQVAQLAAQSAGQARQTAYGATATAQQATQQATQQAQRGVGAAQDGVNKAMNSVQNILGSFGSGR
ncbi:MAG: hypothetical protein HQL18_02605 [Candidatus Omnitrophica bacterium]|nr:hypothetical protein [Candidatus Omnitrophota bacterium]